MSDRREQRAWYFYDFANSAFASTVLTLVLGPYLTSVAKAAAGADGLVHPLGIPVDPRSWWSYVVSLSVMLQVLTLPLAGAAADRTRRKKQLLGLFAWSGAAATTALVFVGGSAYLAGGLLFVVANVAFGASMVVYNSFLPQIAGPEEQDHVSSRGWALGYLGGGTALALNLVLFFQAGALGISQGEAARINLALAGLWWAVFTVIPVRGLRSRPPAVSAAETRTGLFTQWLHTLRSLREHRQAFTFLVAYLLYNDAVQAVISLSGQFGADELKIPMGTLAAAILMVQFVAAAGAYGFSFISKRLGTKRAILVSLVVWIGAIASIWFSIRTTAEYFVMAAVIATVLGGTQALSRSLFSQLIPPERQAEYFSLYEISDKGTSWMAPLFFGIALQWTGSYRLAILSLLVFFVAGFLVLLRVRPPRSG